MHYPNTKVKFLSLLYNYERISHLLFEARLIGADPLADSPWTNNPACIKTIVIITPSFFKFSLITENYLHVSDFSFNYWTVKIHFNNFNERK
jgi:hypothetical protein